MRTFVLVMVLLGVAGIVQMRPSPSRMMVGVITDIEPGRWITIASDQTDPHGFRIEIALRNGTRVDGNPRDLRRDARVQVSYAAYGGGGFVARRVIILPDDPRR